MSIPRKSLKFIFRYFTNLFNESQGDTVPRFYNHFLILFLIVAATATLYPQQKKRLDHNIYDLWKRIEQPQISKNGELLIFEVNTLRKDGVLNVYDRNSGSTKLLPKGKGAKTTPNGDLVVTLVKPGFDTLKAANLKKVKKDDLPKDSLAVYFRKGDSTSYFADVKSFKLPEYSNGWMAIHFEKLKKPKEEPKPKDSTQTKDTSQVKDTLKAAKEKDKPASKAKKDGTDLLIWNPLTSSQFRFTNVEDYATSESGNRFAFVSFVDDSVDTAYVVRFNTESLKADTIVFNGPVKSTVLSRDGLKAAFLFSADTSATAKNYDLYIWEDDSKSAKVLVDSASASLPPGMRVSVNYDLNFSDSGKRLFYGIAKALVVEPEETLLDEEKPNVEVWSWHDPILHTQQNFELNREKKKTFQFVFHLDANKSVQLTDSLIEGVSYSKYTDNRYALGASSHGYKHLISWDDSYSDIYSVDMISGERKLVKKKISQYNGISPLGNYIIWYDETDSSWYSHKISSGKTAKISTGIDDPLWNVENDVPDQPGAYGIGGWMEDDEALLIFSQFDVWLADPDGGTPAKRITNGRENNNVFRSLDLDRKLPWHREKDDLYFSVYDQTTREAGYAVRRSGADGFAKTLFKTANIYNYVIKAENSEDLLINRESQKISQNIYHAKGFSPDLKMVSDINPQQSEYVWSDVQLVKYHSIDGKPLEGLIYFPEDLDKTKKYPMMVYFYEKDSDNLNRYWTPGPSRSIINPNFYASNQYVVFIPDIVYEEGFPGKGAYNCIVGGTLSMLEQFPFIDREKIGLQGQSWGGYQTAFLITQTNLYKAAMAGAPVSNMTSAYGGIRWGSGLVRQFQYEKGQSRIGASLWDKLELYIANSPLFFLDRVNTPLLIMANDKDDAVPWYQGIELFTGLRRLQKPVWMLNYTGDVHNLKENNWGNRVDLSIRMLQFFDHYLKGSPAPDWMTKGVKAIERDKVRGY